jgi:hypothetical protein
MTFRWRLALNAFRFELVLLSNATLRSRLIQVEVHPFLSPPPIRGTRNISISSSFKHPSIYKRADLKQIGQVIEDFFLWMASVKIGRNVVGHDIGSLVAYALARSHPSVVRRAMISTRLFLELMVGKKSKAAQQYGTCRPGSHAPFANEGIRRQFWKH